MATVGPLVPANNTTIQYGGGGASKVSTATTLKRKTPSELRGELLKRKNVIELVDESPSPVTASTMNSDGVVPACKKDLPKNPRYIDIRMDELFPVRKNSIWLRLQSKEEISKENAPLKHAGRLNASSVPSHLGAESQPQIVCKGDSVTSVAFSEDRTTKTCNTAEKCSESTFRSVAELSLGAENLSGLSNLDMEKALKGLVANDSLTASASLAESLKELVNLRQKVLS
ncbi:hypothetical protein ACH5RR_005722 [Cinchona calisaya]|uniref:Uncharacterized protein n=1 Tax=Cinchona calisaya TaxID=153742 RepID=A0ABD3ALZ1_9GENT